MLKLIVTLLILFTTVNAQLVTLYPSVDCSGTPALKFNANVCTALPAGSQGAAIQAKCSGNGWTLSIYSSTSCGDNAPLQEGGTGWGCGRVKFNGFSAYVNQTACSFGFKVGLGKFGLIGMILLALFV